MLPDLRLPGWLLALLLILIPGTVVGMWTMREVGSLAAAVVAGVGTAGGVASILTLFAGQRRR